jgi:hypothetical protein
MDLFEPGEVRLVASLHYMDPEIPKEIAASVREVIDGPTSAEASMTAPPTPPTETVPRISSPNRSSRPYHRTAVPAQAWTRSGRRDHSDGARPNCSTERRRSHHRSAHISASMCTPEWDRRRAVGVGKFEVRAVSA